MVKTHSGPEGEDEGKPKAGGPAAAPEDEGAPDEASGRARARVWEKTPQLLLKSRAPPAKPGGRGRSWPGGQGRWIKRRGDSASQETRGRERSWSARAPSAKSLDTASCPSIFCKYNL